jgi:hypothetical protein
MTDPKTIEAATREKIAEFLPDALATALSSYHLFSQQEVDTKAKEFNAHHTACKVAIAHIELLIKLARWAELPDPSDENQARQMALALELSQAQDDLDATPVEDDEE